MADIQPSEIPISQHVSKLVFGVNVADLNFRGPN